MSITCMMVVVSNSSCNSTTVQYKLLVMFKRNDEQEKEKYRYISIEKRKKRTLKAIDIQ